MFCGTCQGQEPEKLDGTAITTAALAADSSITDAQLNFGKPGDKSLCVTCSATFPFLVKAEEKCYVTCNAGYFESIVGNLFNPAESPSLCGTCVAPCETCSSCGAG